MSHPDQRLRLDAAAVYAGVSVYTLRDRIRHGHLKAERVGPHSNSPIVVRRSDLDAMLNEVGHGVNAASVASDALGVTLARIDVVLRDYGQRLAAVESEVLYVEGAPTNA